MNSPQKDTVKGGSIKTLTSLPHIYAIVLMGLFTFIFLSVEYMFVNELSLLVSEQKATLSQLFPRIMYLVSVQQVFYYILCLNIS